MKSISSLVRRSTLCGPMIEGYPLTVAMGILGLWGTNLWLVVDELKEMQNKHKPLAAAPAGPAPVTPGPGVPMPVPASPPGAPPKVIADVRRRE